MNRAGVYLRHMLDAIEKIESYVAVGRETFLTTSHWHDAVMRQPKSSGRQPSACLSRSATSMMRFRGAGLRACVMC